MHGKEEVIMLKAIALVENKDGCGLLGEHGLSVYIEYQGKKILLDMGTTDLYAKNSERLVVIFRLWIWLCCPMPIMTTAEALKIFARSI